MAILRIHLMLSVLLVLAAAVLADFTIMSSDLLTKGNDGDYHMKVRYIFVRGDGHLNCDNLWNVPAWEESIINDVSGDKQGVRYKGVRPTDPTLIEFNTNFGHYTMYKNRDYHLAALDDADSGQCRITNSFVRFCTYEENHLIVKSIVRCKTDTIVF
ncbi:hypothetical protein G7054_g13488 [Neopestalotiopsis clavispora]|nr:hypothetical protein G7054_g13488 [Neopestalotiopsis clavispora]